KRAQVLDIEQGFDICLLGPLGEASAHGQQYTAGRIAAPIKGHARCYTNFKTVSLFLVGVLALTHQLKPPGPAPDQRRSPAGLFHSGAAPYISTAPVPRPY